MLVRARAAHRPAHRGAPTPHLAQLVWILTAEAWGPPVHSHPMLAALVGIGRHAGTETQPDNTEHVESHILPHPSFILKDAIYFRYKSTTSPHRPAVAVILTL